MRIKRLFCRKEVQLPWLGFSMWQNHSCADYIFNFDVRRKENGRYYVTGECRNAEGYLCAEEKGIRLKKRTVEALGQLRLEQLPEDIPTELPQELADVMILDDTTSGFSVEYPDGRMEPKKIPEEMFLDIACRLKTYFRKRK